MKEIDLEIYNFYVLVSENLCLNMKNNKKYGLILNYNKKRINNTVTLLDVGKILNQTETENDRNRFEWKNILNRILKYSDDA